MANWINREAGWKKRETKDKFTFGTQRLFGVIKNLHRRIVRSKLATVFPAHETIKTLKNYQIEFELQKSKAIAHSQLKTRLI
ncbi:MAG: hypothetical protein U9O89_04995 [Thermoproteota archaeon]|nr:hypothetical protein [Thermoproteota archaeon]